MSIVEARWIWRDGEYIAWNDARVHVLSIAVQFGSSVFEGIRCYDTPDGPAVFRLEDHLRRLADSCRIYRFDVPWTAEQLTHAVTAAGSKITCAAQGQQVMLVRHVTEPVSERSKCNAVQAFGVIQPGAATSCTGPRPAAAITRAPGRRSCN
jgi:branched-subunit amino acid aminotransferase/4-amino-4-deoxychorismate lyase